MRGKWLPQDVSLADAARAVGVTADTWSELQAKAKAGGMVLLPGPRTQVIDLCQEGLCMATATADVQVTNGEETVKVKVCGRHLTVLKTKSSAATQEGHPIRLLVTEIGRVS